MNRYLGFFHGVRRKLDLGRLQIAARAWLLQTDVGRWRRVAAEEPAWDERNRLIAQLIPPGSSVLDLGSGAQTLARHLKSDCTYQPCDCVASSSEVLLCDFNRDQYPTITSPFDFAVVSGVLEYVRDPRRFLERIRSFGKVLLIAYADLRPGQTRVWRASQGWVNHLSRAELERTLAELGLSWSVVGDWQGQTIYRVQGE